MSVYCTHFYSHFQRMIRIYSKRLFLRFAQPSGNPSTQTSVQPSLPSASTVSPFKYRITRSSSREKSAVCFTSSLRSPIAKCLRRLKPPLFQRSKHPSRPQYAQLFQLRCPFRQKIQPLAVNFINSLRLLLQNLLCQSPQRHPFLCPSATFRRNRLALCRLLLPQQCQKMSPRPSACADRVWRSP